MDKMEILWPFFMDSLITILTKTQRGISELKGNPIKDIQEEELDPIISCLLLGIDLCLIIEDSSLKTNLKYSISRDAYCLSLKDDDRYNKLKEQLILEGAYYRPLNIRYAEDLEKVQNINRFRYFIILVNLMAFYDYNSCQNNRFDILMRLFFVLGGGWFETLFWKNVNEIETIKREYQNLVKKEFSCNDLLEFVYGSKYDNDTSYDRGEFEDYLFNAYTTLININSESENNARNNISLINWLFGENEPDYIDAKPLVKALKNKRNGESEKVHLSIRRKEKNNTYIEEGYYGLLFYVSKQIDKYSDLIMMEDNSLDDFIRCTDLIG